MSFKMRIYFYLDIIFYSLFRKKDDEDEFKKLIDE